MAQGEENAEKNVEGWFQDRVLAEIAINRAFHVNESCPALYTGWLPHMFGSYFQIGWGVQHPVEVCELAFEVVWAKKSGIPCGDVLMGTAGRDS